MRQLLEWQEELRDAGALQPTPPGERVYVFTPKGTVIDLPEGATPIDFAYAVHTEVGHAIRGARVNGKIAPLGRKLQTGEQVQVQTAKGGRPSRDWLRAELQLVRTQRARGRIARWFKAADYAQHAADGRAILERELSRLGLKDLAYDKIARAAAMEKTDDLLAALGAGDVTPAKALAPFRRMPPAQPAAPPKPRRSRTRGKPDEFRVSGVGNLLTRMANCCRPIPGDAITGFITSGRGISIHRRDCNNITALDRPRRERLVEVQWNASDTAAYPVEIRIHAHARGGLLDDITQLLKEDKVALRALDFEPGDDDSALIRLRLEISGVQRLGRIMRRLARVANVREVRRVA